MHRETTTRFDMSDRLRLERTQVSWNGPRREEVVLSPLLKELTEKLRELPEDSLKQILQFVESLRRRQVPKHAKGSPEALLPHAGAWSFAPEELEHLLDELERLRQIEIET